jgi:hypothetical protein
VVLRLLLELLLSCFLFVALLLGLALHLIGQVFGPQNRREDASSVVVYLAVIDMELESPVVLFLNGHEAEAFDQEVGELSHLTLVSLADQGDSNFADRHLQNSRKLGGQLPGLLFVFFIVLSFGLLLLKN